MPGLYARLCGVGSVAVLVVYKTRPRAPFSSTIHCNHFCSRTMDQPVAQSGRPWSTENQATQQQPMQIQYAPFHGISVLCSNNRQTRRTPRANAPGTRPRKSHCHQPTAARRDSPGDSDAAGSPQRPAQMDRLSVLPADDVYTSREGGLVCHGVSEPPPPSLHPVCRPALLIDVYTAWPPSSAASSASA